MKAFWRVEYGFVGGSRIGTVAKVVCDDEEDARYGRGLNAASRVSCLPIGEIEVLAARRS